MKTGAKSKIHHIVSLIAACFFILNSCGLETFYFLEAPLADGHNISSYSSSDKTLHYFSFLTNETGDNSQYIGGASSFIFLGTEVYYKIYNNYSTMESFESTIDTYNTSSSYSVSYAAEKIVANYVPLNIESSDRPSPLIKTGNTAKNRYVYIRLNSYGVEESYKPVICISDSLMKMYDVSTTTIEKEYIPRRSIDDDYGFNFNSADEDNPVPKSGDLDVNYTSTASEDGVWYVDMYAVSYGRDEQYSESYSHVLHLGSISITESDYDD